MSANINPIFTLTPNTPSCAIAAANNTADGSGALVTLFTAGTNGSRVDSITFNNAQATPAASSAMTCKVFVTDAAGANPRMISEVVQPTATRSATVIGASVTITFGNGLLLVSGQLIKVTQSVYAGVQDAQVAVARGGDY